MVLINALYTYISTWIAKITVRDIASVFLADSDCFFLRNFQCESIITLGAFVSEPNLTGFAIVDSTYFAAQLPTVRSYMAFLTD